MEQWDPYGSPQSHPTSSDEVGVITQRERDFRQWAMFLHFSVLLGLVVVPIAGWIAPIVIWQIKKDEFPEIDEHGRIVVNWMISSFIYGIVSFFLIFLVIGIPMMAALGVVSVVFPLIGGIKANQGEIWPYPLSLRLI